MIDLEEGNFYIVMDFDRTLTTSDSFSSYEIIFNNKTISRPFYNESKLLNDKYEKIEIDSKIDNKTKKIKMKEWLDKSIQLLIKYNISEETINKLVDSSKMQLRKGAKDFLKLMQFYNIQVIIISAGIENVIIEFLKANDIFYNNITVISNFFIFNNDKIKLKNDIVYAENKDKIVLPKNVTDKIKNKKKIVLLGDRIDDIKMINNHIYNYDNSIKIGFLDDNIDGNLNKYNNEFDFVLTNNASFYEVASCLGIPI